MMASRERGMELLYIEVDGVQVRHLSGLRDIMFLVRYKDPDHPIMYMAAPTSEQQAAARAYSKSWWDALDASRAAHEDQQHPDRDEIVTLYYLCTRCVAGLTAQAAATNGTPYSNVQFRWMWDEDD